MLQLCQRRSKVVSHLPQSVSRHAIACVRSQPCITCNSRLRVPVLPPSNDELSESDPSLRFVCTLATRVPSLSSSNLHSLVAFFILLCPSALLIPSSLHRTSFLLLPLISEHPNLSSSQRCCMHVDMSDLPSSSTDTIGPHHGSRTGGTCFLDLPLELRTMIYDLSLPRPHLYTFPLRDKPKAKVKGINLLRSCRQIREETQDRIWSRHWIIQFPLGPSGDKTAPLIDFNHALSGLTTEALAKISLLQLSINLTHKQCSSIANPPNLQVLTELRSLLYFGICFSLGHPFEDLSPDQMETAIKEMPLLTGVMIQILMQIPKHLHMYWSVCYHSRRSPRPSGLIHIQLNDLAERYKTLKGSAYDPKIKNSSHESYGETE